MIPKIIHNIWLPGYHLLPEDIQKNHLLVKKQNPEWEFKIWDKESFLKLLKKYPDISSFYKKQIENLKLSPFLSEKDKNFETEQIETLITQYIVLKEYGGLYYDIYSKCPYDFNTLFKNDSTEKDQIYLVKTSNVLSDFFYYLYPFFDSQVIDSNWMAFTKNHPIWSIVLKKLVTLRNSDQISSIFDHIVICHQEFDIQYFKKNEDCIVPTSFPNWQKFPFFGSFFQTLNCYYKQVYLIIVVILMTVCIHHISVFNSQMFSFPSPIPIPGIPSSSNPNPNQNVSVSKTKKKSKK